MNRFSITPRQNWQQLIFDQGLTFLGDLDDPGQHRDNQTPWREDAYYGFTRTEVEELYSITKELFEMCLKAAEHVIENGDLMTRMGIPERVQKVITQSWDQDHPTLYSRFDLARDSVDGRIKMIEINGDTPTGLVESSLIQWNWLETVFPGYVWAHDQSGQYNSIHENLIEQWKFILAQVPRDDRSAIFSARVDYFDDILTTEYLRDLATQAGFETHLCDIRDITLWQEPNGTKVFGTPDRRALRTWFKLYPWEWLINEEFGAELIEQSNRIRILEPAWKLILSNKAILPVLWQLYPGHPNLMPAFFEKDPSLGNNYVIKPQYGRESTGIHLFKNGMESTSDSDTPNPLSKLEPIYQGLVDIPSYSGYYPLLGSWVVGDEPCGLMIREDISRIITGSSRIVPHLFED